MSGGSYDYLCHKEFGEFVDYQSGNQLENMRDRLAGLEYGEAAAKETEELILLIRQVRVRGEVALDRLRPIWRAVEWWDSADSSEEVVRKAIAEYEA